MTMHRDRKVTIPGFGYLVVLLMIVLFLHGCTDSDEKWQTKDITGLMPPLAFTLRSANSKSMVDAQDYRGKILLMYFGYMHCPDVCPMTLSRLQSTVSQLGKRASEIRILFVSVDPRRDSLDELGQYVQAFGQQVVGLRGGQQALQELTKRYRVTYGYDKPDADGDYTVSHSSAVYVFDHQGQARLLIRDSDSTEAIRHDLEQLLAESH